MKRTTCLFVVLLGLSSMIFSQTIECDDLNPNSGKLLDLGIKAYDKDDYETAINNFSRVLPGDTNYYTAQYELGLAYGGNKNYVEQERIARTLLSDNKGNPVQNYNMLGNALDEQKKSDEALMVYDSALSKFPNNYLLHFNKGISLFKLKKYEMAEKCFIASAGLNPLHQGSHYFLGIINLLGKRYIQGTMAIQYALILNSESPKYDNGISILDQASNLQVPTPDEEIKLSSDPDVAGDFEGVNAIYSSLIALNDKYKPKKLPGYRIIKQMMLFFDNIESVSLENKSFYTTNYMPLYLSVKRNKLINTFFAFLLAGVDKEDVVKLKQAEKKNYPKLKQLFATFLDDHASKTTISYNGGKMEAKLEYYSSGHLKIANELDKESREIVKDGLVLLYYEDGGLYKEARLKDGLLTGTCKIFRENGSLMEEQNLVNGVEQGAAKEYYSTGQLMVTKEYKDGELNGAVQIFYPDGKLMLTYNLSNGSKSGIQKYYYSDGKLASEFNFLNGKYEGSMKEYYDNGKLQYDYFYLDGKLDGEFKNYYPDGVLKEDKKFLKGELVGQYTLYHGNGQISLQGMYDEKSKRTGVWKEYYSNGKLKNEYTYLNGEKQGNGIEYTFEGVKHYEYTYSGGNYHAIKFYNREGNIIGDFKEDKGVLKYTFTSINGIRLYEGGMKDGSPDGLWTNFFTTNAGISKTVSFKNGVEEGEQVTYYAEGVIKSRYQFKNGLETGRSINYYEDGENIKTLYCCTEGDICGNLIGYFPNGNKRSVVYYLNGELNGPFRSYDLMERVHNIDNYENGDFVSACSYDSTSKPMNVLKSTDGLVPNIKKYPNGQVYMSSTYLNGRLHDSLIYYFPDGKVRSRSYYQNGKAEGTLYLYNHLGIKVEERSYSDNKLNGPLITYYENGKISRISHYYGGVKYGKTTTYFPNGTKDYEVYRENDLKQGKSIWYDENGKEVMTVEYFDDSPELFSYKDKSSNWLPDKKIIDVDGKVLTYHSNGKKYFECTYAGGKQNGTSIMYYSNGNIYTSTQLLHGAFNGKAIIYYPNGKLAEVKNFWMDERHGVQQFYSENGVLLMELNYEFGNLNGPCKYYNQNGKLMYTVNYYQDEPVGVTFN